MTGLRIKLYCATHSWHWEVSEVLFDLFLKYLYFSFYCRLLTTISNFPHLEIRPDPALWVVTVIMKVHKRLNLNQSAVLTLIWFHFRKKPIHCSTSTSHTLKLHVQLSKERYHILLKYTIRKIFWWYLNIYVTWFVNVTYSNFRISFIAANAFLRKVFLLAWPP